MFFKKNKKKQNQKGWCLVNLVMNVVNYAGFSVQQMQFNIVCFRIILLPQCCCSVPQVS